MTIKTEANLEKPNYKNLPDELWIQIINKLDPKSIINLSECCRLFNNLTRNNFDDVVFTMDFKEIQTAKKPTISEWLKNVFNWKPSRKLPASARTLNASSRNYSIIKIKNFTEHKIEKGALKALRKTLKKKAKETRKLILTDSKFNSLASLQKLLKSFVNVEQIELESVKFIEDVFDDEVINSFLLQNLRELKIADCNTEILSAFSNCTDLITFDIKLLKKKFHLKELQVRRQIGRVSSFVQCQNQLEILRMENVSSQKCFLYIQPSSNFQLKELSLCNIAFFSPQIALNFLKNQQNIKKLKINLTLCTGDRFDFFSTGMFCDVTQLLLTNFKNLEFAMFDCSSYVSDIKRREMRNIEEDKELEFYHHAVAINEMMIENIIEMSPNLKTLVIIETAEFSCCDLKVVNSLKHLHTLAVRCNPKSLESIALPPGQLLKFEFKPKHAMNQDDFAWFMDFIIRHDTNKRLILR